MVATESPELVQGSRPWREPIWHNLTAHRFPRSIIERQVAACLVHGEGEDGRVSARPKYEDLQVPTMASDALCPVGKGETGRS